MREECTKIIRKENKVNILLKICRICTLVWICSFPIAFGTIAITNGDFTQLGVLLEQTHVLEKYTLIKAILNVGLNLHISTALPSAIALINFKNNNGGKR